jgi:3-methyladenine DNA glycosylase AlkD
MNANKIIEELYKNGDQKNAIHHQKFFKCFKGGYGDESDIFCGIYSKNLKNIAKRYYQEVGYDGLQKLIDDNLHEARSVALAMLVLRFDKFSEERGRIVEFYLKNRKRINNWDLVDLSVYKILGRYYFEKGDFSTFYKLSSSNNLWEQRMSIVANWYLIHKNEFGFIRKVFNS